MEENIFDETLFHGYNDALLQLHHIFKLVDAKSTNNCQLLLLIEAVKNKSFQDNLNKSPEWII